MSKKAQADKAEIPEQEPTPTEPHVAQIRELIFGQQMTDYESRFAQLEDKMNEEIESLRLSVEEHMSELREFMTNRTDDVEASSVPRTQIADSLERLAKTLRG